MVEVRLHGALAQQFGQRWDLDISSPAEAVAAIECGRPGFREAIRKLDRMGMVFRVRTKTHDYGDDDVTAFLGDNKRLDIIPVVRGASAGTRFVIGAILAVVGYAFGWTGIGAVVGNVGVGLMVGSVVEWLTPKPQKPNTSDNGLQSWTFSGPSNTTDQGVPVPVIYGEVLTGGIVVSAGVSVDERAYVGRNGSALIGGNTDLIGNFKAPGVYTHTLTLQAGLMGSLIPIQYDWDYSGFSGAVARRWIQQNKQTMKLELDYNVTTGPGVLDTGTVTVDIVGRTRNRDLEQDTISDSAAVTIWNRVAA